MILSVAVSTAGTIKSEITFDSNELTFFKVKGYDAVSLPNASSTMDIGAPSLPVVGFKYLIPPGATLTGVEIVAVEKEELLGEYDIYPAQRPSRISANSQNHSFVPQDKEIYNSNNPYPGALYSSIHNGTKCGFRVASLQFYPVQYTPSTRKLTLYKKLLIELNFDEGTKQVREVTENQKQTFGNAVRDMVYNPEDVESFSPPVRARPEIGRAGPTNYEYVIIAPNNSAWIDSLDTLAYWKTKKGIPAHVFNVQTDIYDVYTDVDNQTEIKHFISDAVSAWGTIWVLIAADHGVNATNSIPRRLVWADNTLGDNIDTLTCERYYEDLDNNWDFTGDGIYGHHNDGPGGGELDWLADVYVGRMPADDAADAGKYVRRILWFEKTPDVAFATRAIFASNQLADGAGCGAYGFGRSRTDDWQSNMPGAWTYPGDATHPGYHVQQTTNNWPGDAAFMGSSYYGAGYQFFATAGHGSYSGFNGDNCGYGQFITSAEINANYNPGMKCGISVSMACQSGGFGQSDCAYEYLYDQGNVGGAWNSHYGVGYLNSDAPAYMHQLSDGIVWQFFVQVFSATNKYHLGEAIAEAKDYFVFVDSLGDDCWNWCLKEWNTFGDPELPMWTASAGPDNMIVTHNPTVPLGASVFAVNVKDNDGVTNLSNALVTCWCKYDDDMYVTQLTNVSGNASLSIDPSIAIDTMWVTVTKQNYIPYEGYAIIDAGAPGMPTLVLPFDNARIGDGASSTTPTLRWNVPDDPDGDPLDFKVQWDDDEDFLSPINTIESMSDNTGFNPVPPRPEGTGTCEYTINSQSEGALVNGQTYWWRVAAHDGSNYGAWSEKRSFTVNTGMTDWDWFQTTEDQWNTDALSDVTVTATGEVELSIGTEEDAFGPESFEGAFLPAGWSKWAWPDNESAEDWTQGNFASPSNTPYGDWAAIIQYDTPNFTNRSLQTPQINLSGYTGCYLEFALFRNGAWPDTMRVEVSIDGGGIGGTWNEEAQYNPTNTPDCVWDLKIVDLSAYDDNSNVRIAFRYTQLDGNSGGVDYMRVRGTPGATSGTVTSTAIDYDDNPGTTSDWGTLSWGEDLTTGDITVDIQYWSGSWINTPLTGITDNSDYDISSLDPVTHNQIRLIGDLTDIGGTPILQDWTVTWTMGAPNNPPVVTNVSDGSGWHGGNITITYDLADGDGENCTVSCEYWDGSWHPTANVSGDGIGSPTAPGTGKSIVWQSATDYSDESSTIQFRITPNDGHEDGTPGIDNDCDVDNKAPVISASGTGVSGSWGCYVVGDIDLNGTDGGSGFASGCPRYSWTAAPTNCGLGSGYTDGGNPSSIPSGDNTLYIYGRDNVSNETSDSYNCKEDCDPPTKPGTPAPSETPTCDDMPTWTWTASTDALSGMRASNTYHVYWSTTPGGEDFDAWVDSPTYTHTVALASPDVWYCKVIGYDEAGNPSTTSDNGSVDILEVPASIVFIAPAKTTTSLTWNWNAASGATSYDVNYEAGGWTGNGATTSYPKSPLGVNTEHYLNVRGVNASCMGPESGDEYIFTYANVPDAPICAVSGENEIFVDVEPNSNPAYTEFAIRCVEAGQWVQAGGALGGSEAWQTDAVWDVTTVTGLNCATTYNFRVKARNGDDEETALGTSGSATTAACGNQPPNVPSLYSTGSSDQLCFNNIRVTDQDAAGGVQLRFRMLATDPDAPADDVQYYIQINSASDWSGTNIYNADLPAIHTSGTLVDKLFTCSVAPTAGVTYYVRLRAKDPYGSGSYGNWTTTTWTLTYKASGDPEWHQTTDEQFETGTLVDTEADGSDRVGLGSGGSATATYDYTGVTAASGPHDAFYCDVDAMPPEGGNLNEKTEATDAEYDSISSSNNNRWNTPNPGRKDEVFLWCDIYGIAEDVADITQIDLVFEGYPEGGGNVRIWAYNYSTPAWEQIGTAMAFGTSDGTMTRSITSNFGQYIDGTGKLVWGVCGRLGGNTIGYPLHIDYIKVDIDYNSSVASGTIYSPGIGFDFVSGGADWNELQFNDDETNGDIKYDVQYWNVDHWEDTPIVDQDVSPVDISSLTPTTHDSIRIEAKLTRGTDTPYLEDWTVTWDISTVDIILLIGNDSGPIYGDWDLGLIQEGDVRIMNATDRIYVRNDGMEIVDLSLMVTTPNWTFGPPAGNDQCVVMGLFNSTTAPVEVDFNTGTDYINDTYRVAEVGGNFAGLSDGVDIAIGAGEELYLYFKAPLPNNQIAIQDLTITIKAEIH